jgi:hypothetical protein
MGSPESENGRDSGELLHRVRLTMPYFLANTETTQAQWQAIMDVNPSTYQAHGLDREMVAGRDTSNFPVGRITWFNALEFCNRLSVKEGLARQRHMDLAKLQLTHMYGWNDQQDISYAVEHLLTKRNGDVLLEDSTCLVTMQIVSMAFGLLGVLEPRPSLLRLMKFDPPSPTPHHFSHSVLDTRFQR